MNKKILVLGAGNIGSVIARELAKDNEVTVIDNNLDLINKVDTDPFYKDVKGLIVAKIEEFNDFSKYDLVVGALPSKYGYETLKRVIESGTNVVDVSFFNEDPFELDELAKKHSVKAIVDCGFAPGMSNIFVGHFSTKIDNLSSVKISVGGLPKNPKPPWNYQANWCIDDIIEEYIRSPRIIQDSKIKVISPLSWGEFGDYNIGVFKEKVPLAMESYVTDGLRTLLKTIKTSYMTESTYRYNGYFTKIKVLKGLGLLDSKEFLNKIKEDWKIDKDFKDISIMDIEIILEDGINGPSGKHEISLIDEYQDNTTSMARLTGYTAVIGCKIIDQYKNTGIIPPEYLGMDDKIYNFFREEWDKYNIKFDIIGE